MRERYVIHITKDCNMDCFYCYEHDRKSRYSLNEQLKLVRDIAENSGCHEFGIEFLGGEPMLALMNMESIFEYLEINFPGKVHDYIITTNGTILPEGAKHWIKRNRKIVYAVSLDGTKWSNQFRRFKDGTSSFEAAVRNLRWAAANLPAEQVSVHMVTHPYNVGNIVSSVKFIYSLGVRHIGIGTVEGTIDIDEAYCNRFVREMAVVSQLIKNGEFEGLQIDLFNHVKPRTDIRTYIKDSTGKVIGESYGRAGKDITALDLYNSVKTDSPLSEIIYSLRHCVYENNRLIQEGKEYVQEQGVC